MSHTAVVPVTQPLSLTFAQQIGEASSGIFERIKLIALTCFQQIGRALSYLFSTLKNIVEPLPPSVKAVAMVGSGIALFILFVSKYSSKQKLKKVELPDDEDLLLIEFCKELGVSLEGLSRGFENLIIIFKLKEAAFQDCLKKNQLTEQQGEERMNYLVNNIQRLLDWCEVAVKGGIKISALLVEANQLLDEIDRGEEVVKKTAEIRTLFAEVNRLYDGIVESEEITKSVAEARILLQRQTSCLTELEATT